MERLLCCCQRFNW